MKLIKFILILCVIVILILFAAQLIIKNFGSDKIEETIKESLNKTGIEGLSFGDLSIDLIGSNAVITDIHAPFTDPKTGINSGSFSAKITQINFSMKDAVSMLSDDAALSKASIEFTEPILIMTNSFSIQTTAEKLTISYLGKLGREYFSKIQTGDIERILQNKQKFQIQLDKMAFSVANSQIVGIFIDSIKSRTVPVSGLEIAMITSALLPDLPVTRNFIQAVSKSDVTIEPELFARVVTLGTQLLGIGTDDIMESDGKVIVSTEGNDLVISGSLINPIGHFTFSGLGEVNTTDTFLSEVSELTVEISDLDSDLLEILKKNNINLSLQSPIMLKHLVQGDFVFQ
ncbi:MAG: hypothetical protein HQ557_00380 [Bacteroidetes bacterium]|nr:hypothetical protein [Bacteroidota bacterium]